MSLGLWPDAVPYDDESTNASDELRKHFDAAKLPSALLLVTSRGQRGTPWAAHAAIGLARALEGSRTVILADLDFEAPSLHEALGEPNVEGLADALLYGASLERVTAQPSGETFEFVSPGGFTPDPLELLLHPGWSRLLAELAGRNALLLAFAPIGIPGLDAIAERVPSVIVLSDEGELAQTVALLPETIRLESVIRPPQPTPPPVLHFEPVPDEESSASSTEPRRTAKDAARAALLADLQARQHQQPQGAEPGPAEEATAPVAAPVQSPRPAPAPPSRRAFPIRIGRLLAGGSDSVVGTTTAVDAGTPAPAGVILNYSVAVESYDQLAVAMARADSLAVLDTTQLTFYIVPVRVDGSVYYRVMAGPLADSAGAAAALSSLVERGLKTASNAWDLHSTPLAFFLGRFDSREAAQQRMRELTAQGLPSYVVVVPYAGGPDYYHLYGGAYSKDSEAAVMRDLLRRAGLADTLTLRLGRGTP